MPTDIEYPALLESWVLALRAERKAPATIKSYTDGVRGLFAWCDEQGASRAPTRASVNGYIAALLDSGKQPATARSRQLGIRRFTRWLADEGEIEADPLVGLKPPKLDAPIVEPLSETELKALIQACAGKEFRDIRDAAIVRLMAETGIRAGECAAIALEDLDLMSGTVIVRRGKGGKGRVVPIGPQTIQALDRYRRRRASHALAGLPSLWLGERKRGFTYDALHKALEGRAKAAGLAGFHPHKLRHTAAHRWLAAGGSEGGLMAVAGWTRPDMLQRYTKARAAERAAVEARGLNLGDL